MLVLEKASNRFSIFLTIASLAGIALTWYITARYGAGVSADAARYMSIADNVMRGRGFFDYSQAPMVWWPPLYPLLLGALKWALATDVFLAAWHLNMILSGINIALAGFYFYRIFQESLWTYFATLSVLTSFGLMKIYTNIGTDPLFITFSMLFFLQLGVWDGKSGRLLVLPCMIAALAALLRLLGVGLIASGALAILLMPGTTFGKKATTALIFSTLSFLPLGLWIISHNYLQYQTIFGPRDYAGMLPWNNLINSAEKVLNWFYPFYRLQEISPLLNVLVPASFLSLLFFPKKNERWTAWWKSTRSPTMFPGILFLAVYFAILIFTVNYHEHKYPSDDRFEVVLFIFVITLLFSILKQLIVPHWKATPERLDRVLLIIFVLWSIYPLNDLYQFASISRKDGVASNNMYNVGSVRNSPTLAKVRILLRDNPGITLYSNVPAAVWFSTRTEVLAPPFLEKGRKFDESEASQIRGWPGENDGYVVWFLPDIYEIFVTPQELALVADVQLIEKAPDGEIYHVSPVSR